MALLRSLLFAIFANYTFFGASEDHSIHVSGLLLHAEEPTIHPQNAGSYRLKKNECNVSGGDTKDGHFS